MDIKPEDEIKKEPLDELEYDGRYDQIHVMTGFQEISDESCDSDIDFRCEVKIEEESRFQDFQYLFEEDYEEKSDLLEEKSSLRSGHQELGRGNKGTETHDWEEFSCSNCDFTFETEYELVSHLKSVCKGKVKCSQFNREPNSKMYSLKHRILDENILKSKLFKCSECSSSFKLKRSLSRHMLTHQGIKLFKCSECDYGCNRKEILKRHTLTHQKEKLLKCSECDYECNQKGQLKIHLLKHQKIKLFKCSQCDYDCNLRGDLKKHMLKHQKIKLLKCSQCNYGCNEERRLRDHMLSHQNLKLLKCSECNYRCNYKGNLKTHMLKHNS